MAGGVDLKNCRVAVSRVRGNGNGNGNRRGIRRRVARECISRELAGRQQGTTQGLQRRDYTAGITGDKLRRRMNYSENLGA